MTRARDLLSCRSRQEVLVAGVKVATQTPPIRSGKRVIFVTLDDSTGPLDATFFEDAQVGYATTVFHSRLLVVRGLVRRTGPRGAGERDRRPVRPDQPLGPGSCGAFFQSLRAGPVGGHRARATAPPTTARVFRGPSARRPHK